MGVAALVLGIISILIAIIPFCGAIAFLPALIGLILGIVDTVIKAKAGKKKGISIAGLVLSALAVVLIFFWIFVLGAGGLAIYEEASTVTPMDTLDSYYYYD